MNKFKMEYGEIRLAETITKHLDLSAKEMLELTTSDVKTFTGKTIQHDDMTIVVVKIV